MDFLNHYKEQLYNKLSIFDKWDKRKLALMGLEREFKTYCLLSNNKNWNREKEYCSLLDMCWRCILQKENLQESAWEYHEKIKPEKTFLYPADWMEDSLAYCNIFAGNTEELIETLIDDKQDEETFLVLYIGYILCYLNEKNNSDSYKIDSYKNNKLIEREIRNQESDMISVSKIQTFENAYKWYRNCKGVLDE